MPFIGNSTLVPELPRLTWMQAHALVSLLIHEAQGSRSGGALVNPSVWRSLERKHLTTYGTYFKGSIAGYANPVGGQLAFLILIAAQLAAQENNHGSNDG